MTERRTAADFVAVVCALGQMSRGMNSALHDGVATLTGPGAEELRQAVGDGFSPDHDVPAHFDELADRWGAACLASLAVAVRAGEAHPMREYLVAMAIADAQE